MGDRGVGKVAWVFPGQGSQRVGMGRELAEADPEMAAHFASADEALGIPLSEIIFDGPDEALQQTPVQQPAILLTSIAYLRALQKRRLLPVADYVAGHSLGEYAALVAAGSLDLTDALRLVRRRGELMQTSEAGAMAAILGMSSDEVAAIPLAVSAAFHSTLMAPAAEGMRPLIETANVRPASVPLIGNVDASAISEPDDLRQELIGQICGSVRWVDVIGTLGELGVTTFYEIGPGKVLTGLIARCAPGAEIVPAERLLTAERLSPA